MSSRLVLVVLLGLSLTSGNHGHGNTPLQTVTTSSSLQQHPLDDLPACPRLAAFTATTALPALRRLVSDTAFFRYYRFRLCDACASERFAKGECASPECAVCECAENDLPCDTSGRCFLRPGAAIAASCQSSSDDDDGALDLALDVDGFAKWDPSASWLAPEDEKGQDTYVLPRACLPHTHELICVDHSCELVMARHALLAIQLLANSLTVDSVRATAWKSVAAAADEIRSCCCQLMLAQ